MKPVDWKSHGKAASFFFFFFFLMGASFVQTHKEINQQQQQQQEAMEQQLAALASHLSASIPTSLANNIRQQLNEAANETLGQQLNEYLLEADYMKLFSAGFERLAELVVPQLVWSEELLDRCTVGSACSRSKRTKRGAAENDELANNNTTEPPPEQLQSTEPMESVVLAPGLPRPPTMSRPQSHKNPAASSKQRRQQQQQQQLSVEEPGELLVATTSTEMPAGSFMQANEATDAALLSAVQAEMGDHQSANDFRRAPQSAKLSAPVPSPEQNPHGAAESASKSSLPGQSLDSMLDNLDGSSLPDLSSILGQIQANGELENLGAAHEYLPASKQLNNGSSSQQQVKQDRWEPADSNGLSQPAPLAGAPYLQSLDAGRGSSGEFSVRQGALHEDSQPPAPRYSSQFGPIYNRAAHLKLPGPLGSGGGGGQRGRNSQRTSNWPASSKAKKDSQWIKINSNYEAHARPAAVYPDSIQQQLYALTRGASSGGAPKQVSRYHATSGQPQQPHQLGASNHHARIIPMNYATEQQQQASSGAEPELAPLQQHGAPQSQVLGLLQVAGAPASAAVHQHQQQQQQQRLRRTARRASPLLLAASSPLESALRGHSVGAPASQHADYLHLYPAWPAAARYSSAKVGGQRSYQHRIGHGEETAATIATTSTTDPMWTDTHQHDDDYQQSPQTIQITAVPNGLGLVGNGLAGWNGAGWANGFGAVGAGFNGWNNWNGLAGAPWNGRQVLLVNKQPSSVGTGAGLEWRSWLIPVAIILALPLVLGALFVPVFLKSVMFLIQILQMLGILMPPSQLASHLVSGGSSHSQQSG